MSFLALLGPGLFAMTSLVIGLRLVMKRGGKDRLPALLIGIAFLGGGGFGQPLFVLGHALGRQGSAIAFPLQAIALVSLDISAVALWAFTWRVFRPTVGWARTLVMIAFSALAVSLFGQLALTDLPLLDRSNPWFWLGFGFRALSAGWAAFESLRYFGMMQKRLNLGLADPLTTNRFLLWGMSASAVVLFYATTAVSLAIGGSEVATAGPTIALGSFLGIEAAAAMWLAFFPPAIYRARFEGLRRDEGTEPDPR